mgnify:CR=1 FL=1
MDAFGIGTGIYLAVDIAKNIYETTKQLQSLDLALKMVSGSQEEFVSNQVFLKSLAEQYGIEIKGLTKNFTEFWVASKGKLEAEQIKEIFTSISKSVAVMGLSVEQQDSAFLALQQMMSKGTVQAEELKKQLGNALPGAIKAATMAYQTLHPEMKVTEKFFMEQMKAGKVLSSELLPELAKAYEKLYGIENVKRAETLQAAQERLANSWTDLVRNMNESETSGIGAFFGFLINMATQAISWIDRASSSWSQLQKKAGGKGIAIGEQSFNEQLKEDYKPLTSDEKNKIKSRIKEINEEILKASTSNQRQAELRGEKEGLEATLFKSDKKKVLINIRDANRAILDGYIKEYKELDKKTREVGKNLTGDDFDYLVERGIDPKRKEELLQLINEYKTVFYKSNARLISDSKLGNKKPNQAGGGGTGTRSDNDSAERDRLALIEKNAKIEYDLKISNLNREKEIIKDLRDDKETSLEDMLFLEQAYAYKEMQIALAVYEEEVRLAGKSESMQTIALNKFLTEKENLIKESLDRQSKFTVDFNEEQKNKTKEWYKNNPPIGIFDTEANKKDREESEQELKDALKARIKIFNDYVGDFANKSGFGESFDLMTKINPKTGKSLIENLIGDEGELGKWQDYFGAITTIAQDAFNLINQASEQRFEKEYQRLEKDKENALRFAGDSESQRLRIEEEYEKRRKEIAKKQWQAKKKQAISNILIDTAQAVVSTLAQQKGGAISKSTAAAVIGGLGLVQVGIVASQKAPEFYVGTQNAPEGLAWTNERGAELHTDKKGNIKDFGDNKGARLTMLEAGDKIYTAEQTKRILFNDELNNILTSNNIMPSSINIQSNGVSATQMDAIIGKHFSNIQTNNTMIDRNGFTSWTEKNGNKTISDNNRVQRKGLIIK